MFVQRDNCTINISPTLYMVYLLLTFYKHTPEYAKLASIMRFFDFTPSYGDFYFVIMQEAKESVWKKAAYSMS
jgi:hypothetical protein